MTSQPPAVTYQADVLTALMPAVFYYIAEAMIEGGVISGLPRGVGTQLVTQKAYGAARILHDSGGEPIEPRYAVTSPAGTTASAIRQFENHRVHAASFAAAVAAASQPHRRGGQIQQPQARRPARRCRRQYQAKTSGVMTGERCQSQPSETSRHVR
jgi:hypothetical protein